MTYKNDHESNNLHLDMSINSLNNNRNKSRMKLTIITIDFFCFEDDMKLITNFLSTYRFTNEKIQYIF